MGSAQRVNLARAFVLHHRPWRDSSLIADLLTREHGRLTVFAHGARGPKSRFGLLHPFRPLLCSWSGRGEARTLVSAERAETCASTYGLVCAEQVMSAYYLNELLLKLLGRFDPHPELFDAYEAALRGLGCAEGGDEVLRAFEQRLLEWIGYGLDMTVEADTGRAVDQSGHYRFRAGVHGFVVAEPGSDQSFPGRVLLALAGGAAFTDAQDRRQARLLMRSAIDHCLEGRSLATRDVLKAMQRATATAPAPTPPSK